MELDTELKSTCAKKIFVRDRAIIFNAKCEFYSFGIVLLELLSGRQQGADGVFLQDDVENLQVDAAVSRDWPQECTLELKLLARHCCVYKRVHRILSSVDVLHRLQQIKTKFNCPTYSEKELIDRVDILSMELHGFREEERKRIERTANESRKMFDCYACMYKLHQSEGVSCSSGKTAHMMYKRCLNDMVILQASNVSEFGDYGCCVFCPLCLSEKPTVKSPYTTKTICSICDDLAVASFINAAKAIERSEAESKAKAAAAASEKRIEEVRLEERLKAQTNEEDKLKVAIQLHRHRIVDTLLTTKYFNI